jgi:hypothetical protein
LLCKLLSTHMFAKEEDRWPVWCVRAREGRSLGEFWWVGREYKWVFVDDDNTSETFTEQVTHCPGCGRPLDRKTLKVTSPIVHRQ